MIYYKKLVWDRIYLSPRWASQEEIEKFANWINDFNVTDFINGSSNLINYEAEKEYLERESKTSDNNKSFNIVELETDRLLGSVWLNTIDPINRRAILWIFIWDDEYRSKGYWTEAINLILDFGFRYLNLHSISLRLLAVNERAHKSYLKCWFKDIWRSREEIFLNWKYHDAIFMDILESEFKGDFIRNKNIK